MTWFDWIALAWLVWLTWTVGGIVRDQSAVNADIAKRLQR